MADNRTTDEVVRSRLTFASEILFELLEDDETDHFLFGSSL